MENTKGKIAKVKPEFILRLGIGDSLVIINDNPTDLADVGNDPIMGVNIKVLKGNLKGRIMATNIDFLNVIEDVNQYPLLYRFKKKLINFFGSDDYSKKV